MLGLGKLKINIEKKENNFGDEIIRITAWLESVPTKGEVISYINTLIYLGEFEDEYLVEGKDEWVRYRLFAKLPLVFSKTIEKYIEELENSPEDYIGEDNSYKWEILIYNLGKELINSYDGNSILEEIELGKLETIYLVGRDREVTPIYNVVIKDLDEFIC